MQIVRHNQRGSKIYTHTFNFIRCVCETHYAWCTRCFGWSFCIICIALCFIFCIALCFFVPGPSCLLCLALCWVVFCLCFWFFKADIAAILVDATHDAARTDARRFANTDPGRAIRRRGRTRGSGGHCVDISTIRAK